MAASIFFRKRCGDGSYWRCGCCGKDYEESRARALGRCNDPRAARRQFSATGTVQDGVMLQIGNRVVALICADCIKPVTAELGRIAPRSLVDVDNAGNLLGDF